MLFIEKKLPFTNPSIPFFSIARNLIEDPNVIAAFKRMHAERIVALNQVTYHSVSQLVLFMGLEKFLCLYLSGHEYL